MYAVVKTGGKQVKVAPGDVVRVEKIDAKIGDTVELNSLCLLAGENGVVVDPKALATAKVVCEVRDQDRAKKVLIYKMKRRKGYRRTQGHRQYFTTLRVREIVA